MAKYIETKVRSEQIQGDGTMKQVTDLYLVEAESFTEAETRIMEEVEAESVEAVSRSNVRELFLSVDAADDKFYKARVEFISIDEKSMKEKRKSHVILVQASDINSALKRLQNGMSGTISDYEVISINKTAILDYYGTKLQKA